MTRAVRLPAFAKVNLCLHILGRRPDGYHELRTIFQTISLHDTLELALARGSRITVETDDAALPPPVDTSAGVALPCISCG